VNFLLIPSTADILIVRLYLSCLYIPYVNNFWQLSMLFLLKGSYEGMNTLARENILTVLVNSLQENAFRAYHKCNNFLLDATFLLAINIFPDNTKVSCVCVFQFIMLLTVIIQWISMEYWMNDTDKEKVKYPEKTHTSAWTSAGRGRRLTTLAMVRPAEHAKLNFGALY